MYCLLKSISVVKKWQNYSCTFSLKLELNYCFLGGKYISLNFGIKKKVYVTTTFMISSSFWELLSICFVCFIKCLIDVMPLQKHDTLENEFYSTLATNTVSSHPLFNSSLNNASTNATSLNIWWVLSTLACASFVPKLFFFFLACQLWETVFYQLLSQYE